MDESEKILLKAIIHDPKSAYAWNNLGALYSLKNRDDDALNAFRKAVESNPKDPGGWLNLGSQLDQMDRRIEAEKAYREFLKLAPERIMHVNLARQAAEHNRRNRQRR